MKKILLLLRDTKKVYPKAVFEISRQFGIGPDNDYFNNARLTLTQADKLIKLFYKQLNDLMLSDDMPESYLSVYYKTEKYSYDNRLIIVKHFKEI
jgi:hypothetical protein